VLFLCGNANKIYLDALCCVIPSSNPVGRIYLWPGIPCRIYLPQVIPTFCRREIRDLPGEVYGLFSLPNFRVCHTSTRHFTQCLKSSAHLTCPIVGCLRSFPSSLAFFPSSQSRPYWAITTASCCSNGIISHLNLDERQVVKKQRQRCRRDSRRETSITPGTH
jgi:hypothetical protein